MSLPKLNINSQNDAASIATRSRSVSPSSPPYSPITPTQSNSSPTSKTAHQPRMAHSSDLHSTFIPPSPKPIDFNDNPDVLALRSAISILQMQKATAIRDMKTLQRIKMRALRNPREFVRALSAGDIKTSSDPLFHSNNICERLEEKDDSSPTAAHHFVQSTADSWERLPVQQNIVRTPPINFTQYAIISEPLDKLHDEQVARPSEGVPQCIGPGGKYVDVGGDNCHHHKIGVTAPCHPSRDKETRETTLRTEY